MKFFLPESFACDPFAGSDEAVPKIAGPAGNTNLVRFLDEVARNALPNAQLEGVIAAAAAGHHDMKPLAHARAGAFLLAEVTGELLRMSPCVFDVEASSKKAASGGAAGTGMAMVFRLVQTQEDEGAAITLNWKKSQGEWRVASHVVTVD